MTEQLNSTLASTTGHSNRLYTESDQELNVEGSSPDLTTALSFRLATFLCATLLASVTTAQAPPPTPFATHQLTPTTYWIEGGGGNSGVIVGEKGVIVIDAKTTAAGGKELLEDIAKITPKPVTTIILTHSDADHVNGLVSFPTGITIIAHENDKKELEAALKAGGPTAPPADHLPTQVISRSKESLKIDGVKLQLYHWASAHTSGDLIVYLPQQKVVFAGDILLMNFPDPFLRPTGSSEGWITSAKQMVNLDSDQFVAGHGAVQTKYAVQKRLSDTAGKRAKIKDLVAQGKSLDEIKAAVGDPPPAQGRRGPTTFTEFVYGELTKKTS